MITLDIPIEKLSFYFTVLNSSALAIIGLYLKFGVDKRLKKYEHLVGEVSELNTKLHDSIVAFRKLVETITPLSERSKGTFQMIASRLRKHDRKISDKITQLLEIWEAGFFGNGKGAKLDVWDGRQAKCNKLMDEIIARVDKLMR